MDKTMVTVKVFNVASRLDRANLVVRQDAYGYLF